MHQDDRASAKFQGAFDDLPRIDWRVINGAALLLFIGDERVLDVEKQNSEAFGLPVRF